MPVPLTPGTRVRVVIDSVSGWGPWPDGPLATISGPAEDVVVPPEFAELTSALAWRGRRWYPIVFDTPQYDADGEGPFTSVGVLEDFLEPLA